MNRARQYLSFGAFAVALSLTLAPTGARAEDEEPAASDDPSFNFKLPDKVKETREKEDKKEEKIEQEEAVRRLTPVAVKVDFDYPRYAAYVGLNPAYLSLNSSTVIAGSNASFSTSQYVPLSFVAGAKAEFSQRVSMEANVSYGSYSTSAQPAVNGGPIAINSSSANVITANVDGSYCFLVGLTGLKLCPMVGLGIDGFPVFDFAGTNLQIDAFNDPIVRGMGKLSYPVGLGSLVWLSGGYDYGFGKGGANGITISSEHIIFGQAGFSTPVGIRSDLLLAADYSNRSAGFTQGGDTWSTTGSILSLTIGLSYKF